MRRNVVVILLFLFLALPVLLFWGISVNLAGPLPPPPADSAPDPATAAWHFLMAARALECGECDGMRLHLKKAIAYGYSPDAELIKDWGYRCGQPLDDGVNYSVKLTNLAAAEAGNRAAAVITNCWIFIFDLLSSRPADRWHPELKEVSALEFSPDGGFLAVGGGRKVIIRKMEKAESLWSREFTGVVSALAFSPHAEKLAVGINHFTTDDDGRPLLRGGIQILSPDQPQTAVRMKSVPGNPISLVLTAEGKYLIGWCWPERYTYCTISWLCGWDAQTGERKFCRRLRTSSLFSAYISGDGRQLVYARLDPEILRRHARELDQEGRPYDVLNLNALSWLLDPESYRPIAVNVFTGEEAPLVSGLYVLALDQHGRRAVVMDRGGVIKLEEINVGRVYQILNRCPPAANKFPVLADFAMDGNILLLGRTNADLVRFGWRPDEISRLHQTPP